MVTMNEDNRKRKELTPDAQQEKEKVQRKDGTSHVSVIHAEDLCSAVQTTPVSTKNNIAATCRNLGISGSPAKIDIETVHSLVVELSLRVSELEVQVNKKDDAIFTLRKENARLEQQISELRSDSLQVPQPPTEIEFMETVRRELPLTSEGLAEAEARISALDNDLQNYSQKLQIMDKTLQNSARKWHLEAEHSLQYSMRDSIKIFGVPYKANEDTNDIVRRIGISIGVYLNEHDISVSHRTGRFQGSSPRPIVVRFTRRDVKHMFIRNKKSARNITTDDDGNSVRIFIDEHLTPMRSRFCKKLRIDKVHHYTWDGKVFIINEGENKPVLIDTPTDWQQLELTVSEKEELGIFPKF